MADTLIDRRRHDFFIIDNAIFDMGLSPFDLAVYCALAQHANREGVSWPGISRLAMMTCMSERKVRDCLDRLQEFNLVDKASNFRADGGQTSNTYILYPVGQAAPHASPPLHEMHPPPAPHAPKQYSEEEEGILPRPPAIQPLPLFPENDPEWGVALSRLEGAFPAGTVTGTVTLELGRIWPDMQNGRRAWLNDAIDVTRAKGIKNPAYAVTVLGNALRDDKRPGSQPERNTRPAGRDLDAILGITS